MNLYLNQEHQNSSMSLTTNCQRLPAEKLAVIWRVILKSICKHVPADLVVRAQNKFEIRKCFTYWGGDRKICNGHRKSFQKKINNYKRRVATPTFHVMKWKWQAY